jgi:hypothetical protein
MHVVFVSSQHLFSSVQKEQDQLYIILFPENRLPDRKFGDMARHIQGYFYFFCILLTCLYIRSKIFQQAYTDGVGVLLLEAEKVGNHCTSVLMQAQKAAAGFTTVCLCS